MCSLEGVCQQQAQKAESSGFAKLLQEPLFYQNASQVSVPGALRAQLVPADTLPAHNDQEYLS